MKFRVATLAVLLVALAWVPAVDAAADAVPGVSAIVTQGGNPAFVLLRFYISPDDPDQVNGSYTYNVTLSADGGAWVNLGEASNIEDGIGSRLFEFEGSTFNGTFNVTADDGTGGVDSCTVTVNTATLDDHDACGDMDPGNTFNEYFCLDTDATNGTTGFNYARRVSVDSGELLFETGFGTSLDRLAVGGLNLGGDVGQIELDTYARFLGAINKEARLFFSTVDAQVSEATFGNGETTGAFSDGIEFTLDWNSDDLGLIVSKHEDGGIQNVYTDSDFMPAAGNSNQTLEFIIHPDSGVIYMTVGTSSHQVVETSDLGGFHSLWISFDWESSNTESVWGSGSNFCLSTDVANPLTPGQGGQQLPGFEGEGGLGGTPMFPGVNVTEQADNIGMDLNSFALVVAVILLLALTITGFALAGVGGVGIGGVLGVALSAAFNLIPLWALVVLFLLASGVVVVGFQGGRK